MTNQYDPWYVCMNPYCKFETNSERNAHNHQDQGGGGWLGAKHPVERVEGEE